MDAVFVVTSYKSLILPPLIETLSLSIELNAEKLIAVALAVATLPPS